MMKTLFITPHRTALVLFAAALGCTMALAQPAQPQDAQPATVQANAAVRAQLPFIDRSDFANAQRGFMATLPHAEVHNADDSVAWSLKPYAFLNSDDAPSTVNPSLWRQAQLNLNNGLFKVTERIYQIRGFDIANMTIIEGDSGLIIVDPLLSTAVAKAGLDLYRQHRGNRPLVAVVYTHSHVDHFGGVKGVVSQAEVDSGKVQVFAPAGFMEEATGENVLAGNAMSRRAVFQFGYALPRNAQGQVDAGLGKGLSNGVITLIAPTTLIRQPIETHTIDGVEVVFQLTPGTEAPAEMNMFYPQLRALNMAENTSHQMHNLYPLRGAQVRDANVWAKYLNDARERFAKHADVLLMQHHWPVWGSQDIYVYLGKQRDLYKYIHDQSVRLLNEGYNAEEIAEQLKLPESLSNEWFARGYYGTLSHNAKAVYQRYLGWYDANPANLNPLPRGPASTKWVEYMGGSEAVLQRARQDFDKGEYRWVAQVLTQVVFADPSNKEARALLGAAFEQMGYQAESATWRNAYLQGASEVRNGTPQISQTSSVSLDVVQSLSLDLFFDYMGVRLNGPKAEGKRLDINWRFSDTGQQYVLTLDNSALTYVSDKQLSEADASVTLSRATLDAIATQQTTFPAALQAGLIKVEGKRGKFLELLGLIDTFEGNFAVIEPRAGTHP
ncbi:alkyl sulfatase [Polaromonas sp.]|nr:alkyl sulfatase [Polaromonas sp.]